MKPIYLLALCLILSCSHYSKNKVEDGFVFYSSIILADEMLEKKNKEQLLEAVEWIQWELQYIEKVFPSKAFNGIKNTKIILLNNDRRLSQKIAYHPESSYLAKKGFNDLEIKLLRKSVIINDLENFMNSRHFQKFMILHEYSHAYFFHKLLFSKSNRGNDVMKNEFDIKVYKRLDKIYKKNKHKYKKVPHYNGFKLKAYAATDLAEYFAEGSESYFSFNDFYPFNRSELKNYDPDLYRFLVEFWEDEDNYLIQFQKKMSK